LTDRDASVTITRSVTYCKEDSSVQNTRPIPAKEWSPSSVGGFNSTAKDCVISQLTVRMLSQCGSVASS